MKFAHKLVLAVAAILAVSFSVIGFFTITRNFNVALDNAAKENVRQHLFERYSLESELAAMRQNTDDYRELTLRQQSEALAAYIGDDAAWQALYASGGDAVYSSLPAQAAVYVDENVLGQKEIGTIIHRQDDGATTMLVSSQIQNSDAPFTLVSAYDISDVYTERQRQLRDLLWMDAIVLVLSIAAVSLACLKLTKPIRKLNRTSKKIARGAYSARTEIGTDDEIGELGQNFNEMAEAVQAQVEQLNLSVQQREDFVSAFTHEVKTPMTASIGYSDILRFQETKPELRQRAAQFIYREARRLETLSQKLLLLMGLSDDAAEMLPVPLEALFRDAARSVFPVLQDSGIEVKMPPVESIMVLGDKDLLVDLLRNLLLNAIKAQPKDNTVWLRAKQRDGRVLVAVADNGRGIPAEERARITEPFYMVDKSRARREGSSGVGLALCQRIAQLHGGTLDFQSEVGKGTMVSFILEQG
jgi:signal transduction histidine kinase